MSFRIGITNLFLGNSATTRSIMLRLPQMRETELYIFQSIYVLNPIMQFFCNIRKSFAA
jgi:hypothetical protein